MEIIGLSKGEHTISKGIYKITNTKNGKVYIGSSSNIERRFTEHKCELIENKHHSYKNTKRFQYR